jgi:Peptidase_C39 like family
MPLKVNNGTALNPQAHAAAADAAEHIVRIRHRAQKGKMWCWAACMQMVLEHNDLPMTQCKIVKKKLDDEDSTCAELENESCEAPDMEPTWVECGITNVQPRNGRITFETIQDEIAANRPIQVGILWSKSGGHAVLIKGWAETDPVALLIDDPLRRSSFAESKFGTGRATYADLTRALGHGIWRYTWTNLEA